jgi:hypothetical protein
MEEVLGRFLWGTSSLFSSPRYLAVVITSSLALGLSSYLLLRNTLGPVALITMYGLLLTSPVAVAKTATACGINALGTFSRYDLPLLGRMRDALVYMTTAVATASVIGLMAALLGTLSNVQTWLFVLGPVFLLLGLRELGVLSAVPVPTVRWQVPARWVGNPRTAPLVWGVCLGSGLATWMPHATFYGLLLLAAFLPFPLGVALMASYGFIRAVPAVAAAASRRCSGEIALAGNWKLRLLGHALSGAASLALAGVLLAFGAETLVRRPDLVGEAASAVVGRSAFSAIIGMFLALLLVITGASKLTHHARFAAVLRETYRLPSRVTTVSSVVIPVLELIAAMLLSASSTRLGGLGLASVLFAMMSVAATSAIVQGGTGDCGCLGSAPASLGRGTLIRLGVLLVATATAIAPLVEDARAPAIALEAISPGPALMAAGCLAFLCVAVAVTRSLRVLREFGG